MNRWRTDVRKNKGVVLSDCGMRGSIGQRDIRTDSRDGVCV